MSRFLLSLMAIPLLCVAIASSTAEAEIFGGLGSRKTDCLLVLDTPVNDPVDKPKRIRCTDGDPTCDADGTVNGTCVFPTSVCANSTFDTENCSLVGLEFSLIEHSEDNGDPKFDPEFQALQSRIDNGLDLPNVMPDDCTGVTNISVAVKGPFPGKGCRRGKKQMKIESESIVISGRRYVDKDKLKMFCEPAPMMCDAQTFFSGTFDRIQEQIFDVSCALGGCHDSEGNAGGLLLEQGTSYGALVDVDPVNAAAMMAGFKRVTTIDAQSGDPETSFLFRKITGQLGSGLGSRMPIGGKKVSSGFRDILEKWILSGAPETGWVPGTDE